MPTLTEKQLAAQQLIRRLIASPHSFKGSTLSGKKYDFFYQDPQTNHTLFSALIQTQHYTCAKNILKRLPEKSALYRPQQDDKVMRFCNFEQCGEMVRFLKAPNRRAMALAQLPFKTRNELSHIAQLIKTRLSVYALEEWSQSGRPKWEEYMTSSKYTAADATARALEEEEERRYEIWQERVKNTAQKAATPAPAPAPTPAQPASLTNQLSKIQQEEQQKPKPLQTHPQQTNFEDLLFQKQGRE